MSRKTKIIRGIPVVLDVLKGQSEEELRVIFGNSNHFDEQFITAVLTEAELINGKPEVKEEKPKKSKTKKKEGDE